MSVEKTYLVSVILPVYKTEKFLQRCLDSLLAQTYSHWEALCVDDGSPDHSGEILDDYAARDSRFKVFHCPNGGAARARNFALDHISGEYCFFMDSDDFIHPQLLEIGVHFALLTGADTVAWTYDRTYHALGEIRHFFGLPDKRNIRFPHYEIGQIEYKSVDELLDWASEYSKPKDIPIRWAVKHCQPWRVMLRSARVTGIHFTPDIMYEDVAWWGEVMLECPKACILNLPLYYYYPNPKGYIHAAKKEYRRMSLKKALEMSRAVYAAKGTEKQRDQWEKHFVTPFLKHSYVSFSLEGKLD